MIAASLTSVPGASEVFKGAIVSYANADTQHSLGVTAATLQGCGAVSEQTALQMAAGAREALAVDLAVATTGIAGPDGGSAEKPVGTVWIAVATPLKTSAHLHHFQGDREQVRSQATRAAL
jgi:nicotinamide-nucleotide amidase